MHATPAGPSEEPLCAERELVFVCLLHRGPDGWSMSATKTETPNVLQPCLGVYGALSFFHSSLDLPNLLVSGA